jgi:hypothetical protein
MKQQAEARSEEGPADDEANGAPGGRERVLAEVAALPGVPGVWRFVDADDGVVRYASAHIEPVESELVIVPYGHSVQGSPRAIEEVRRILYEHAGIR